MTALPPHRHLLTTLITTLCSSQPVPPASSSAPAPSPSSPLHTLSPKHHRLLLTLHVLFPTQLLPALDLLDRGLVTRLRSSSPSHRGPNDDGEKMPDDSGVFLVKSLATTLTRRNRDVSHSSKRYIVHLQTWNCSCPNFTFEAFPNMGPNLDNDTEPSRETQDEQLEWSFGGLSLSSAGDVPCCKHLLACLLLDRWPDMMGQYSSERIVTREEMAGIVTEI